ncbi:MAG: hypothetical protein KGJ86_07655, partial [Chloroflexota bacterium]|nr:hypothetical protein [Chloroflexota bacterium]
MGVVGAVGSRVDEVVAESENQLRSFGYKKVEVIKVSDLFGSVATEPPWSTLATPLHLEERYKLLMDAGDALRERMDRKDATILLALDELRLRRASFNEMDEAELQKRSDG